MFSDGHTVCFGPFYFIGTTDPVLCHCFTQEMIMFYKGALIQGRGVHVTGVSAAYTFKLNKNILSE
jgi:hypothetical protein